MTPFAHLKTGRDDQHLHVRIRAEFSEMPGLTLTLAQASKLFNLEPARCEVVLTRLVQVGAISTNGRVFVRAGSGRVCA